MANAKKPSHPPRRGWSTLQQCLSAAAAVALASWFYLAIQPPPPRLCGSEGGPPVTAARIRLRDGRFLAYAETGVPREHARYKIVFCHGFRGSRLQTIGASPELLEELGVYMVGYDRAGHAESDPNPRRSLRSEASDIEELADALELGTKFYLIGFSLGGHGVWASLKYIPGRLAGATLLAPVVNYWWPGFPKNLSGEVYNEQALGDQWALRVGHYAPWLLYWWQKQSWLPSSTVIKGSTHLPNLLDAKVHGNLLSTGAFEEELLEELGVYIVSYDRAGYRESDPNPKRSPRSEASDIEELADALDLGSRFYLIGFSLGGHGVWASLKYIPGRLAGAVLLAPVINYRWPGFPKNLSREAYNKQPLGDQWALRVSYYAPWLLNWWMKKSWLPSSTVVSGNLHLPNRLDAQVHGYLMSTGVFEKKMKLATQQSIHESFFRDMMVMFGKWEFDPMDLYPTPFPVHVWQGDEDGLVPVVLQRYICSRLSWIEYHELPSTGHYLSAIPGFGDLVLKTLLLQPST